MWHETSVRRSARESSMSGILFLIELSAFVLLCYWALRNDKIGLTEGGSGLFAMRDLSAPAEPKAKIPNWKQALKSPPAAQKKSAAGLLTGDLKPKWARTLPKAKRRF